MAVAPRKTTNAKVGPAGRRVATKGEPQFASYAEKTITPVMEDFAEWLTAQTGYKVDPLSVQLGSALRGTFQKSEFNQNRIATRAEEREAEAQAKLDRAAEREEKRAAKEQARAERAEAKASAPAKSTKAPAKGAATAKAKTAAASKKPAAKPSAKVTPLASRRRPASTASKQTDF
jgi:hypothetical protein